MCGCREGDRRGAPSAKGDQVNLSRMGGLGVAVAAGLATIAAMLAPAAAQASASGGSPSPAVTHYTGTRGVARLVPRHKPAVGAPSALRVVPRGARRLPSGHFSAAEAVPGASAATAAAAAAAATSSSRVSFNGVSSRDSQFTNFEQTFEPPDQGLCKGNGFVLEPVNSAYRIYRTNGKSLRGPFNINDLFNVGGKEFTSDPRCWFDPRTQTWFATILFLNDSSTASSLLIAVRHNSDPRGLWNEYSIDTTDPSGSGCPCFGDQPRIGIDQTNLYVTADEFSILGPQFNGAEMWAIDKSDLVNGVASPHVVSFPHLTTDTTAPQPALSTGRPDAEYFLSSLDPSGTGDNRIGVWAMTNRNQVGLGGMPTLSSIVINSEAYAIPPPAPQKGAKSRLDSGDDRMQQTQFVGSTVWGELTTAVRPARQFGARGRRLVPGEAGARQRRDLRRIHRPPGLHRRRRQVRDLPGGATRRGRERGGHLHPDQQRAVPERRLCHPEGPQPQLRAGGRGGSGGRAVQAGRVEPAALGRLLVRGPGRRDGLRMAGDRVHPAQVEPDHDRDPELGNARHQGTARLTTSESPGPSPGDSLTAPG